LCFESFERLIVGLNGRTARGRQFERQRCLGPYDWPTSVKR
jgi:hypothetical protein